MAVSLEAPGSVRAFVPPAPPKTAKAAETRRRLLELAANLFIERSYHAVSMRDLGAAAALTTGAVYGHFRSKGQLLVEVIRWKIAERDRVIDYDKARSNPDYGISLMYDNLGRDTRLLEVDAAAAARHDPEVAAGLLSLYGERQKQIRDALSHVVDPDAAVWVLTALQAGIGMKESIELPTLEAKRLTTAIAAAIGGLVAQGDTDPPLA